MKIKVAMLAFATLLASSVLKAQLGVNVGCNFARLAGLETGDAVEKSLAGFSGGIFYDKSIVSFLDLRVGAMYSPKGNFLKHEYPNYNFYNKTFLKYIEVPVQIKAKSGPFYALGGVYAAYAVKSNIKLESGGGLIFDEKINIRRIDIGLKIGTGYDYKLGPVDVFVQGDYSLGLLNISDDDDPESILPPSLKNRVFGLSAGVIIDLQ